MLFLGVARVCMFYMHFASARGKFKIDFTRFFGEEKNDED